MLVEGGGFEPEVVMRRFFKGWIGEGDIMFDAKMGSTFEFKIRLVQ